VLTAIDDVEVSRASLPSAERAGFQSNVADDPPHCDFYFGSQIRQGPLQILISTNGRGPKMAKLVRRRIEESITFESRRSD